MKELTTIHNFPSIERHFLLFSSNCKEIENIMITRYDYRRRRMSHISIVIYNLFIIYSLIVWKLFIILILISFLFSYPVHFFPPLFLHDLWLQLFFYPQRNNFIYNVIVRHFVHIINSFYFLLNENCCKEVPLSQMNWK